MKTPSYVIVKLLHGLFVLFCLLAPFVTNNEAILTYHFLIVPIVVLHWLFNNDICVLTEIESLLATGSDESSDTFIGKVLNPVIKIERWHIRVIALIVWVMSFIKLRRQNFFFLRRLV